MSVPQVVWANWYQFLTGECLRVVRLESRMLLWCRRGGGTVSVNAAEVSLPPGGFAWLPWGCAIAYQAERRQPFLLGGVHLIPNTSGPWHPGASHGPEAPIPGRRDDPSLPQHVITGWWSAHPALHHFAEHLAERWSSAPPDLTSANAQGVLLTNELRRLRRDARSDPALPPELSRVLLALERRPALPWSLNDLATSAGCSPAWLTRLFARHVRTSPRRHLAALRLERACELLRSSDQSIAEVGAAVGLPDPFRFSKVFRTAYGLPPSHWRRSQRGI